MRSFSALLIFLSVILVLSKVNAREAPGEEYWKRVMGGEAIKGLLGGDDSGQKLVKDFQTKANVIIYHGNEDHAVENQKLLVHNYEGFQ